MILGKYIDLVILIQFTMQIDKNLKRMPEEIPEMAKVITPLEEYQKMKETLRGIENIRDM